jgi:hypothetical protein
VGAARRETALVHVDARRDKAGVEQFGVRRLDPVQQPREAAVGRELDKPPAEVRVVEGLQGVEAPLEARDGGEGLGHAYRETQPAQLGGQARLVGPQLTAEHVASVATPGHRDELEAARPHGNDDLPALVRAPRAKWPDAARRPPSRPGDVEVAQGEILEAPNQGPQRRRRQPLQERSRRDHQRQSR